MELNTLDIYKFMLSHSGTRNLFLGVFPRDRLPMNIKYPSGLILNTDTSKKQGEHWLAIFYDKDGHAEFFDSYGVHPSFYKLDTYINKTSTSWTFNNQKLQSFSTFCGHYCCLFLLYRFNNYSLYTFINKFSNSTINNDMIIHELIKKGFFK